MKTAKEIIGQEYGSGKNFMTPHVIKYGKIRRQTKRCKEVVAFELSEGVGFSGQAIYGVSVVSYNPATGLTRRRTELSSCFPNLQNAEKHIAMLKKQEVV